MKDGTKYSSFVLGSIKPPLVIFGVLLCMESNAFGQGPGGEIVVRTPAPVRRNEVPVAAKRSSPTANKADLVATALNKGDSAYGDKNYDEAEQQYRKALSLNPNEARAYF